MGRKISVDSATMMNKGLEMIEAHWLFGLPPERIEVVVHPQSVIHSLVEYVDGSMLAQLGHPDMRTPIAQALAYPDRIDAGRAGARARRAQRALTFEAPDHERFPCLGLAYDALARRRHRAGGPQCGERSRGRRVPRRAHPLHRHRARLRRSAGAPAGTAGARARRRAGCRPRSARRRAGVAQAAARLPDGCRDQGARVPGGAGRARRVPRARALRGGALVPGQGAAVLGRLRARRVVAPLRPRPHGMGHFGGPARRLREDGRRAGRRRSPRATSRARSTGKASGNGSPSSPPAPSRICCLPCCSLPAPTWPAFPASARCSPRHRRTRRRRRRAFATAISSSPPTARRSAAGRTCAGACCGRPGARDVDDRRRAAGRSAAAAHRGADLARGRRLGGQFHARAGVSHRPRRAAHRRSAPRQARGARGAAQGGSHPRHRRRARPLAGRGRRAHQRETGRGGDFPDRSRRRRRAT